MIYNIDEVYFHLKYFISINSERFDKNQHQFSWSELGNGRHWMTSFEIYLKTIKFILFKFLKAQSFGAFKFN